MPPEPELPAELMAVESLLQQFSPTTSAMNRDALLYEAGWAAAKMQAQTKFHWFWPATSAALAASLLFFIASPQASSLQRAGTEPPPPSLIAPQTQPTPKSLPKAKFVRTSPVPLKRYSPKAPFLAMRDRALRQDFDELPIDTLSDDLLPPTEITHRQLLEQLLPGLRTQSNRMPIWPSWNLGETS